MWYCLIILLVVLYSYEISIRIQLSFYYPIVLQPSLSLVTKFKINTSLILYGPFKTVAKTLKRTNACVIREIVLKTAMIVQNVFEPFFILFRDQRRFRLLLICLVKLNLHKKMYMFKSPSRCNSENLNHEIYIDPDSQTHF